MATDPDFTFPGEAPMEEFHISFGPEGSQTVDLFWMRDGRTLSAITMTPQEAAWVGERLIQSSHMLEKFGNG